MIEVKSLEILNKLPQPQDEELAKVQDKIYQYRAGAWEELPQNTGFKLTLYDLNKQVMTTKQPINFNDRMASIKELKEYVKNTDNIFYMLLCNDIKYYTIFNIINKSSNYPNEFWSCLDNLGKVKAIGLTENKDAIEIWFTDKDNNTYVAYFFAYDGGVIICQ